MSPAGEFDALEEEEGALAQHQRGRKKAPRIAMTDMNGGAIDDDDDEGALAQHQRGRKKALQIAMTDMGGGAIDDEEDEGAPSTKNHRKLSPMKNLAPASGLHFQLSPDGAGMLVTTSTSPEAVDSGECVDGRNEAGLRVGDKLLSVNGQPCTDPTETASVLQAAMKGALRLEIVFAKGNVYEGEWKEGKKHGRGKETYATGNVYDGEWLEGRKHGRGKQTLADGSLYDGEFQAGKRYGHGKEVSASGAMFEGEYVDGSKRDHGNYIDADGEVEDGGDETDNEDGESESTAGKGDRMELTPEEKLLAPLLVRGSGAGVRPLLRQRRVGPAAWAWAASPPWAGVQLEGGGRDLTGSRSH